HPHHASHGPILNLSGLLTTPCMIEEKGELSQFRGTLFARKSNFPTFMYTNKEDDACVELGYLTGPFSLGQEACPEISKAGGRPAWFGKPPLPMGDLICRLCGEALFLVVQVYAPTKTHRSLCLFCCNRPTCSVQPAGWRIIRTQESLSDGGTGLREGESIKGNPVAGSPKTPAQPEDGFAASGSGWGGGDQDWATGAGGWGTGVGDWDVEVGDWSESEGGGGGPTSVAADADQSLSSLLAAQEQRSQNRVGGGRSGWEGKSAHQQANESRDSGKRASNSDARGGGASALEGEKTVGCFPPQGLDFLPEPPGLSRSKAGELDVEMTERLRRYQETEEDQSLLAALDRAMNMHGGGGGMGIESMKGSAATTAAGAAAAGNLGEKYEKTPAKIKAMMRFSDRVARAPQQVVRYAYQGQPLWSSSCPPQPSVPKCSCGADRVFEMQLMPALLFKMRVDEFAKQELKDNRADQSQVMTLQQHPTKGHSMESKGEEMMGRRSQPQGGRYSVNNSHGQVNLKTGLGHEDEPQEADISGLLEKDEEGEVLPTVPVPTANQLEGVRVRGMEWGTVAVWCCPASCTSSFEEFVVVQPPE
ncbi:unnamed protein product, partial [Discosporangium mesarthrocarpum]